MNCRGEFCSSPINLMLSKVVENDNIALRVVKNRPKMIMRRSILSKSGGSFHENVRSG